MNLDETCLNNGEIWTFLTNKDGHGGRGTLGAAIPGTKSDEIIAVLVGAMDKSLKRKVREVTCDLSPSLTTFMCSRYTTRQLTRYASTSAGNLSPKAATATGRNRR